MPATSSANHEPREGGTARERLFSQYRWLPFVLPFVVYMLLGSLEPAPPAAKAAVEGSVDLEAEVSDQNDAGWISIPYRYYPFVYGFKIAGTLACLFFVWPAYREFPLRWHWLAIVVGVLGVIAWVGLSKLRFEPRLWELIGMSGMGGRSAFNPLRELADQPALAWAFLAVRFLGLVVIVPIIEEFFLRGFLMRYAVHPNWWAVPFGTVNATAVAAGTLFPMLSHPAELLAAAVWFSAVTWLMVKTKNIWDCVLAHAITNLLLGIYVVWSGDWHLM